MIPAGHRWIHQEPDGGLRPSAPSPRAILSGSFNPLHHGHRTLADIASKLLNQTVAFELSTVNVDKPALADDEVRRRLGQFVGVGPVVVTRAATFAEKAAL